MRYVTLTSIVDGALDYEEDFFDYALLEEQIRAIAADAEADGIKTEVYTLEHDHPLSADCECVQFVTDHKPRYTFPGDTPPAEDEHPFA